MTKLIIEPFKTQYRPPLTAQSTHCINILVMKEYSAGFHGLQAAAGPQKSLLNVHLYGFMHSSMRTTIDLPDPLLERVKISAAKQQTTMRDLVIKGLEVVLNQEEAADPAAARSALQRLRKGFALGNRPLSRDQAHAR
jgi:hypothetical protein